jgi:hypothetical protein
MSWAIYTLSTLPFEEVGVCAEVQRSSRHIEDRIQATLVLKCSSKGFAHA